MNTQITELKLSEIETVVGGVDMSVVAVARPGTIAIPKQPSATAWNSQPLNPALTALV
jgi:hypothetical protein